MSNIGRVNLKRTANSLFKLFSSRLYKILMKHFFLKRTEHIGIMLCKGHVSIIHEYFMCGPDLGLSKGRVSYQIYRRTRRCPGNCPAIVSSCGIIVNFLSAASFESSLFVPDISVGK